MFPKFLELFFTLKNTPSKVKNSKMGLNHIFFGTPSSLFLGSCSVKSGQYFCSWDYTWVGKMKNNKKCKAQCKASSGCKGWTRYKSGEYKGWCGLTTADTSCVEEDATFDSGVLEC